MLVCLLLLLLLGGSAFFGQAVAHEAPALQRLSIYFELEKNLLHGTSMVDLPAGHGATLHLGDLQVEKIVLNQREELVVEPGVPLVLPPLEEVQQVEITYQKRFPPGGGATGGLVSEAGITLTGGWHPFPEGETLYELTAAVPEDFEAVAEAEEVIATRTEGGNRFLFRFPHPLRAMHFTAGPYVVEATPFGDQRTLYTYFFPEDQELAPSYRSKTSGYLQRYEEQIGPFPYRRFSVVENRLPTGFAMPTFTLLGQMVVRLPFITETSLGHEVLHQWFGNAVEVDPRYGNWAEGLTTYLADQAYAADQGEDVEFRKQQLIRYQSHIHPENRLPPSEFRGVSGNREVRDEDLRAVGYHKVSMLFHMLRRFLGREQFEAGLQHFYLENRFQQAGWPELITAFETTSDEELDWFFEQWLTRADVPELAVTKLRLETVEGQPVLSFLLRQQTESPYRLQVPLRIGLADGTSRAEMVEVTETETPVRFELDQMARELVLDPEYDLMRRLAPAEFPPVWSRFIGAPVQLAIQDPETAERYAPMRELLAGMEIPIKSPEEVTDAEIAQAAVIFLGPSRWLHSLFAKPEHPATGFTVDVRPNPLNPDQVAVLISASSAEEAARGSVKLRHYGKYSYLHFANGRIQQKEIRESELGQRYTADVPPRGVAIRQALDFEAILADLTAKRVVYAGEVHTSVDDHDLQLRIIRGLHQKGVDLAIGMEMFPGASQEALDGYVAGEMDEWEFLKKSNYFQVWGFDYRLYRDIINFARRYRIPLVSLNLPKALVSKVFKEGGIGSLTPEEIEQLPEFRNLDLPEYRERLAAVFSMHGGQVHGGGDLDPAKFSGFLQAQALWDEAMAESVVRYLEEHPEKQMVVVAGRGHVAGDTAIPPRVERRLPGIAQAIVLNTEEKGLQPEIADYLLFNSARPLPPPPMIGVSLAEAETGIRVVGFSSDGGARQAGLREGDLILAIDDEPIGKVEDLKIVMLYKEHGQTARLRLFRERQLLPDQILEITVPL